MRLHIPSAGLGPVGPKPMRPYARAYASRRLRALASLSMARSIASRFEASLQLRGQRLRGIVCL
jgi:hypothetical protein